MLPLVNRIEKLKLRLSRSPGLVQLAPSEQEELKCSFRGLPEEYVHFLGTIGFGNFEVIQLYSGPVTPSSVYPRPKQNLSHIILFGDDFQGYCFGFDMEQHFALVEVDPRGNARRRMEDGFVAFIEGYAPE